MKQLRIHLWREWREHRRSLYMLAGCLALAVAGLTKLAPQTAIAPIVVLWTMMLVMATVTISVGADLFASERQRGTDAFLRRTPGGLSGAFAAKLLFFGLLLVGSAIYGGLVGSTAFLSRTGELPKGVFELTSPWTVLLGTAGLLWIFAASTWVKSGALTIPATVLFLIGALGPVWWTMTRAGSYGVSEGVISCLLVLTIVGSVTSAHMSFVGAGRRGHTHRRATITGLGVACLFFAPTWAWAGQRYAAMQETRLTISTGMIGEGGRHLFLSLRDEPLHASVASRRAATRSTAVLFDLHTGESRLAGDLHGSSWIQSTALMGDLALTSEHGWPVVALYDNFALLSLGVVEPEVIDGRTALPLTQDPQQRVNAFWTRRGMPEDWKWDGDSFLLSHAGSGYEYRANEGQRVYRPYYWDPATNRVAERSALLGGDGQDDVEEVRVGPGRWLVRRGAASWSWIDPESGESEAAECIRFDDRVCNSFDDGSLLLLRGGRPMRLDGVTAELESLGVAGSLGEGALFDSLWTRPGGMPLSSTESSVLALATPFDGPPSRPSRYTGLAILDPTGNSLEVLDLPGHEVLGNGPGFALLKDHSERRLLKLDLETHEARVLLDLDRASWLGIE